MKRRPEGSAPPPGVKAGPAVGASRLDRSASVAGVASVVLLWACAGGRPPEAAEPPSGPPPPAEPAGRPPAAAQPPAPGEERAPPAGTSLPITESITSEPSVRIGIEVGASSTAIMSTAGLRLRDGESGEVLIESGDEIFRFRSDPAGTLVVEPAVPGVGVGRGFTVEPLEPAAGVVLAGRPYRGAAEVWAEPGRGLIVVNRIPLEEYLLGVVPAEIGPREPEEFAAVRAQAVAARTYTIARLGSRDSLGFDLFGTVEDQVYGGVEVERADVGRAIRETEGEILTYEGEAVQAFYHSTCGGRTATRYEVWAEPDLPYLRSVPDRKNGDPDYCSISPRYRWHESWTAAELNGWVRAELARWLGVSPSSIGRLVSLRVLSRTEEDRVDELEVASTNGRYVLRKNEIRFVLRPTEGRILGSTDFTVRQGRVGEGEVVVEGRGFGHGIGMCQWGAIGRARAGQSYRQILSAYYQGVEIEKLY